MNETRDFTSRDAYPYWYMEKIRFSDTDMIGHVNNVAFAAIIESGRVNFTHKMLLGSKPTDAQVVMRRLDLEYRAELHFPAEVDIGSRLLHIGRTSFSIANGVFNSSTCVATSVTTLVVIDRTTRRPHQIADDWRAVMSTQL